MTEEEKKEFRLQNRKKREEAERERQKIEQKERDKLQDQAIMVGDQVIIKQYDTKREEYKYLCASEYDLGWTPYFSSECTFTIEPLLIDKSSKITKLGYFQSYFPPNSKWAATDMNDEYEDVLENVTINCSSLKQTIQHSLNKNQPFCLTTETQKMFKFFLGASYKRVIVNKWEITRIKEEDEKLCVYTKASYCLSTLAHNKIYYLSKDDARKLTLEKKDRAIIELEIINKADQENEDKEFYNQLENDYSKKYLGYENEKLTLVTYEYFFEVELDKEDKKGLMLNKPFRIKIPDSKKYLRSIPSNQKGMNELVVSECASKAEHLLYFYLQSIQPLLDITKAYSYLLTEKQRYERLQKQIDIEGLKNAASHGSIESYLSIRRLGRGFWTTFISKEPNSKESSLGASVCLNGYISIKQAKVLSQFWNLCKKNLELRKLIRQECIRKQFSLKSI